MCNGDIIGDTTTGRFKWRVEIHGGLLKGPLFSCGSLPVDNDDDNIWGTSLAIASLG